jgi:hypothetical protein
MRFLPFLVLCGSFSAVLPAQNPAAATLPGLKFHGAVWASAVTQDRETPEGSLVFRPMEAGQCQFSLDGALAGVEAQFARGWSAKVTLLAGHVGKVIQTSTGDTGTLAAVEAMMVWSSERDTLRIGRMITFIGMEFLDGSQDITASRGILFSFADPFGQVGVNWHHTFTPVWSADVWAFNGEDRFKDNNLGKTLGFGLSYNHLGSADNYLALHLYRGPEQDRLGSTSNPGAEGRMRERLCLMGQGIWGRTTLQGEVSLGRERFPEAAILGARGPVTAAWRGYGLIFKVELLKSISLIARAEQLADDAGVRLAVDTTIRKGLGLDLGPGNYSGRAGANLVARNLSFGVEKKHGPAFGRIEIRRDSLNAESLDSDGKPFRHALSGTVSVGASF